MANNQITYSDKTLTNTQLLTIWNYQQRLSARSAITRKDRAKKTITEREYYNKLAQIGRRLKCGKVSFRYEDGWGILHKADGTNVMNATLGDFVREVESAYGKRLSWYYEGVAAN